MKYQIFRLAFSTGVHFGSTSLEGSDFLFCADTLFSALCIEAQKIGGEYFERFYRYVKDGVLLFSDGLPYINDNFYIPRPHLYIENPDEGNSGQKKAFKKLSHIPVESLREYLEGKLDAEKESNIFRNIGVFSSRTCAAVRGKEDTLPYRVGVFEFREHAGIYILVRAMDEDALEMAEELLVALSFTGIGGKRSQGLGKFDLFREKNIPSCLKERLGLESNYYMTLSVSMPQEGKLDQVIAGAGYQLIKRSGFVYSDRYAESFQRKKDIYLFASGSCFQSCYEGDIYDVSGFGNHPVYRYAKPLFMGVDR